MFAITIPRPLPRLIFPSNAARTGGTRRKTDGNGIATYPFPCFEVSFSKLS